MKWLSLLLLVSSLAYGATLTLQIECNTDSECELLFPVAPEPEPDPIPDPEPLPVDLTFAEKCAQPGVIFCEGFETQAAVDAHWGSPSESAIPAKSVDGHLRMYIAPHAASATTGDWTIPQFGPISTGELWVQYRARVQKEALERTFDTVRDSGGSEPIQHGVSKLSILWGGDQSSCTMNQYVTVVYGGKIPSDFGGYTRCGAGKLARAYGVGGYSYQYGGDTECIYSANNPRACYGMKGGGWYTLTMRLDLDAKRFDQWVTEDNGRQIHVHDTVLDVPSDAYFNRFMLTGYQTGKSSDQDHPIYWMDWGNLIVSTAPIAIPGEPLTKRPAAYARAEQLIDFVSGDVAPGLTRVVNRYAELRPDGLFLEAYGGGVTGPISIAPGDTVRVETTDSVADALRLSLDGKYLLMLWPDGDGVYVWTANELTADVAYTQAIVSGPKETVVRRIVIERA